MPVKYSPLCNISICYFLKNVNNKNMDKQALKQNLIDSGCNEAILDEFISLYEEGKEKEVLRLLARHKTNLLDNLHDAQKKIDCLDYLIFNLKQN